MTTGWPFGILLVIGGTLLAVAGMLIIRRKFELEFLRTHHEVAGALLGIVGTLYAVLLAFVIVEAMSNMQQARITTENEANALASIFRIAGSFPNPTKDSLRGFCVSYCDVVIHEEWDNMPSGVPCMDAWKNLAQVWGTIRDYEPVTESQKAMYSSILASYGELGDARRTRLTMCRSSVSNVLWTVLIIGAVSTIALTYFFGVESLLSQTVMTIILAVTLSLNIYLLADYNSPYSGELRVRPDAFKLDMMIWHEVKHFPLRI